MAAAGDGAMAVGATGVGATAGGTIGITAGTTGTITGITGNFRGCAGPRHANILRCGAADPHRRAAADAVLQYQLSLLLSASAGCKNCPAFADGGCDIRKKPPVRLVGTLISRHPGLRLAG